MYAIIETGGKQYRVEPGQIIDIDRLSVPEGETVTLDRVLLLRDGERTEVGTPTLPDVKVMASSLGEVRGKKIIVLKFKPKVRYTRKQGHRQLYTRLQIKEILRSEPPPQKPKRKRRATVKTQETE